MRASVYVDSQVERVLHSCTHVYDGTNGGVSLTPEIREAIHAHTERLASQGLRVLALASRRPRGTLNIGDGLKREDVEQGHRFIGLAGIYDPPRPESAPAVAACKQAGIVVHM